MRHALKFGRRVSLALFVFLLLSRTVNVSAAPAQIILNPTDWRTGELEVSYTNATPGNLMQLYVADYRDPDNYKLVDMWVASAAVESHISQYFENGQTLWYYVQQMDPATNEQSEPSNIQKQTPPMTVYITNWPEMLEDLKEALQESNENMADKLEGITTPSEQAMDDLKNAIEQLKNAVGAGQVGTSGSSLNNAINNGQAGMKPPIVTDDGNGTYTGGQTGGNSPFPTKASGPGGQLISPDLDSGTDTELTMRIPYGVDMQGQLLYMKLFTQEQMEKMKWLGLLRTLAAATIWIIFAFWLVQRFTPTMKV